MPWLRSVGLQMLAWSCAAASHAVTSHSSSTTAASPHQSGLVSNYNAATGSLKQCADFKSQTGVRVTKRERGLAVAGAIRVLVGRSDLDIYVIGAFNDWGKRKTEADRLLPIAGTPYYEGKIRNLAHAMEYRLLVNGKERLDPAALSFTPAPNKLNSVFWDFGRPDAPKLHVPPVDLRSRALITAEAEVYELARKYPRNDQEFGPIRMDQTYVFVARSGVINDLKAAGYNTIEFLPFNASIDSPRWQDRYRSYGLYAPDPRYGNPDEFAEMIAAFHRHGIAVTMRAGIQQFAVRGNQTDRELAAIGLQHWQRPNGNPLFAVASAKSDVQSFDFGNRFVRRFLSDSLLHMVCRYGLSGIRFEEDLGDQSDVGKKNRAEFIQAFAKDLQLYRPEALLISDQQRIQSPQKIDKFGLTGKNAFRGSSPLLASFEQMFAQSSKDISLGDLKTALERADFERNTAEIHQLTSLRFVEKSAILNKYLASRLMPRSDFYIGKKTMALGSLAMLTGNAYRDLPQTRLLQDGSFINELAVDWDLMRHGPQRNVYDYFAELSQIFGTHTVFAQPEKPALIQSESEKNEFYRIFAFTRQDRQSRFLIVINLGHVGVNHYKLNVPDSGSYRLAIDSDSERFGGSGELERRIGTGVLTADAALVANKNISLSIPYIAPYATVLLRSDAVRD